MKLKKPKLSLKSGRWFCISWEQRNHVNGKIEYIPIGSGDTPADAWDNAFPPSFMDRAKRIFQSIQSKNE